MVGKEALIDLLKQQKKEESRTKIDWIQRRQEWLTALDQLFDIIEKWLKPAVNQDLLKIERSKTSVCEEHIGKYEVPVLVVTAPNGRRVDLIPHGRQITGGQGRVDLESGPKRSMLLRTSGNKWKFLIRHASHVEYVDLTDDSLADFLRDLLA